MQITIRTRSDKNSRAPFEGSLSILVLLAILEQAKAQLAQAEAQSGKTQLDVDRDIAENKHCGRVRSKMASHLISFSARSNRSKTRCGRQT